MQNFRCGMTAARRKCDRPWNADTAASRDVLGTPAEQGRHSPPFSCWIFTGRAGTTVEIACL